MHFLISVNILQLPDEALLTVVKLRNREDWIKLSCVHTKFYRVAHDRQILKIFRLNKDPYRNPELCADLKKHIEEMYYQRGTLWNFFELSCIQSALLFVCLFV